MKLFGQPFEIPTVSADPRTTSQQNSLTRRGEAKVSIIDSTSQEAVGIPNLSVNEERLFISWVENHVDVEFERVRQPSPDKGGLMSMESSTTRVQCRPALAQMVLSLMSSLQLHTWRTIRPRRW
jgi:hypothetical protein